MLSTRELLSSLSNYCYSQLTFYKFNKRVLKVTDKYREGRLAAIGYTSELTLYYMNKEKKIQSQIVEQIDRQMKANSCINDGDYKNGLYDALNDILDEYKRISTLEELTALTEK